jgi:hypothetical protein
MSGVLGRQQAKQTKRCVKGGIFCIFVSFGGVACDILAILLSDLRSFL